MTSHYKHGDRVVWRYPKQHNAKKIVEKYGTFISLYSGNNPNGLVWCRFDGNKNPAKVPQHELAIDNNYKYV